MSELLKRLTGYEDDGIFAFPNYPRPSDTNRLFSSSGKRKNEVIIGGSLHDWDLYCMGYWRAADALVDHVTQAQNPGIDRPLAAYWESQAYAILFLYRHYLELRLKELFMAYGGEPTVIDNEHRLLDIWDRVKKQDEAAHTETLPEEVLIDLDTADKIIKAFDQLDRDSQTFRYPKDRKGKLTVEVKQIDLVRLKKALGWLSKLLDGWSGGVHEYMQAPRD